MVSVVNRDDKVRSEKALGVDHIATLTATVGFLSGIFSPNRGDF